MAAKPYNFSSFSISCHGYIPYLSRVILFRMSLTDTVCFLVSLFRVCQAGHTAGVAFVVAIDAINADPTLLPHHQLVGWINSTDQDSGKAISSGFDLVRRFYKLIKLNVAVIKFESEKHSHSPLLPDQYWQSLWNHWRLQLRLQPSDIVCLPQVQHATTIIRFNGCDL